MSAIQKRPRRRRRSSDSHATLARAFAVEPVRLRYVDPSSPGFTRERDRGGFLYRDTRGRLIRDRATLERIRRLAIPPAWTDVWISPDPAGHLQATGRDSRRRLQYRYHPQWREERDRSKFERLAGFGRALPAIRRRVAADLRAEPLSRRAVLAAVVNLLESTLIRVGNEEYARNNHSYGLTTLRNRHVQVRSGTLRFRFRGKGGIGHEVELHDPRLARLMRRLQELPGQELFQYVDASGQTHNVSSGDVNEYLREAAGADVSAKDFRTWAGTLAAAGLLADPELARLPRTKRRVADAVREVARLLGNTPAVCRKCYIHPDVIADYLSGASSAVPKPHLTRRHIALDPAERALLRRLRAGRKGNGTMRAGARGSRRAGTGSRGNRRR